MTAIAASARATASSTSLRLDGIVFHPEFALTSAQQQRGLMFRKRAPADGMLFVFRTATSGGFWMKNTRVPLRIVFFVPQNPTAIVFVRFAAKAAAVVAFNSTRRRASS